MKHANLEVEVRFVVKDLEKLHRNLKGLGLKCLERWRGHDTLFDKDGELRSAGRLLRLRWRSHWGNKARLTYKGPYRDHLFKVREELETWVEDFDMALKILGALGYRAVVRYEKLSELWEYAGTEIIIEELPRIGCFVEIEGPQKNIKKVIKILGYDIKDGTKRSYREFYGDINKNKKDWRFGKR